jgi:hypothetical protein
VDCDDPDLADLVDYVFDLVGSGCNFVSVFGSNFASDESRRFVDALGNGRFVSFEETLDFVENSHVPTPIFNVNAFALVSQSKPQNNRD